MKKKFLALLLVSIMVLTVTACGEKEVKQSSTKTDDKKEKEVKKEPTDLTGTWKSEDNDGSYQEATVTGDTIEINWVSDEGKTKSIYWVGTYTAPTEYVEKYNWTSDRDKEKTDSAILASTDDTKEFTYKDETISYEASAAGTTTTVELKKQ